MLPRHRKNKTKIQTNHAWMCTVYTIYNRSLMHLIKKLKLYNVRERKRCERFSCRIRKSMGPRRVVNYDFLLLFILTFFFFQKILYKENKL